MLNFNISKSCLLICLLISYSSWYAYLPSMWLARFSDSFLIPCMAILFLGRAGTKGVWLLTEDDNTGRDSKRVKEEQRTSWFICWIHTKKWTFQCRDGIWCKWTTGSWLWFNIITVKRWGKWFLFIFSHCRSWWDDSHRHCCLVYPRMGRCINDRTQRASAATLLTPVTTS